MRKLEELKDKCLVFSVMSLLLYLNKNWASVQQHHADHIWSESTKESKNGDVMSIS